jgi:HPt (histidine-containing phosphotransfer) domain-containing protein
MAQSGDTSTTQLSRQQLVLRFLMRTREEVTRLRACLPTEPLALEPEVLAQLARVAHKIASTAEPFGFPEISVIAGAVELLAHDANGRTVRERYALAMRLDEKVVALEIYVEHALAEAEKQDAPPDLPLASRLPRFGSRRR